MVEWVLIFSMITMLYSCQKSNEKNMEEIKFTDIFNEGEVYSKHLLTTFQTCLLMIKNLSVSL